MVVIEGWLAGYVCCVMGVSIFKIETTPFVFVWITQLQLIKHPTIVRWIRSTSNTNKWYGFLVWHEISGELFNYCGSNYFRWVAENSLEVESLIWRWMLMDFNWWWVAHTMWRIYLMNGNVINYINGSDGDNDARWLRNGMFLLKFYIRSEWSIVVSSIVTIGFCLLNSEELYQKDQVLDIDRWSVWNKICVPHSCSGL